MATMPLGIESFSVEELEVGNEIFVQVSLVLEGGGKDPKWPLDANVLALVLPRDQAFSLSKALEDVLCAP